MNNQVIRPKLRHAAPMHGHAPASKKIRVLTNGSDSLLLDVTNPFGAVKELGENALLTIFFSFNARDIPFFRAGRYTSRRC